jgi:hypothetical protein
MLVTPPTKPLIDKNGFSQVTYIGNEYIEKVQNGCLKCCYWKHNFLIKDVTGLKPIKMSMFEFDNSMSSNDDLADCREVFFLGVRKNESYLVKILKNDKGYWTIDQRSVPMDKKTVRWIAST